MIDSIELSVIPFIIWSFFWEGCCIKHKKSHPKVTTLVVGIIYGFTIYQYFLLLKFGKFFQLDVKLFHPIHCLCWEFLGM